MFQEGESALLFPPRAIPPGSDSHLRGDEATLADISTHVIPTDISQSFSVMCEFWSITSEWMSVYYAVETTPVLGRVPVEFANRVFQKLLAWSGTLNIMLARGDRSSHHSIIFQLRHTFSALVVEQYY